MGLALNLLSPCYVQENSHLDRAGSLWLTRGGCR
jgi:hypothetical protein